MPRNRRCKMQHFSKVIKSEKSKVENMTKNELNDCHEMKADENKDPSVSSDDADADDADVDVDGFDDDYDGKFKDQAVNDVIGLVLEIQEPLYNLKRELERETGLDLSEHQLFLQDSQPLSLEMTLVDQCLQGEGLVQINLEIKVDKGIKKINIVDVIQPSDDAIARAKMRDKRCHDHSSSKAKKKKKKKRALPNETDDREQETWKQQDTVTKWVVSKAFRDQMETLQIPTDPTLWHRMHVKHWAEWVVNEFPDTHFDPNSSEWDLDGKELCNMSHDEFKKKVVDDPGDLMWTHLELLRNVKFVAVVQRKKDGTIMSNPDFQKYSIGPSNTLGGSSSSSLRKTNTKPPVRLGKAKCTVLTESSSPHGGNRSGNNGQVQLWQFLLELLTDKEHRNVIHWIGDSGEFKLENPETVAQLWGTRKNKPNMNYEKLSRALRYYYDGDMISKVHGKRFVYKFVCNLKNLIGYTASELNNLVIEAEQRSLGSISVFN